MSDAVCAYISTTPTFDRGCLPIFLFEEDARVLIVAPHADDAELGCPALLQIFPLASVLLLSGDSERRVEAKSSAAVYGAELLEADFRDGSMQPTDAMIAAVEGAIAAADVSAVFSPPSIDEHQDHRAAAFACASATRRSTLTLVEYETPSTPPGWAPNLFIPWDAETLDVQTAALDEYRSQSHRPYLMSKQRSARGTFRALRIGAESADAYRIVRQTATRQPVHGPN